jgi:hypothetical protein
MANGAPKSPPALATMPPAPARVIEYRFDNVGEPLRGRTLIAVDAAPGG